MNTLLSISWNASPELFSLGPISVRWYGLMFAVGFLIGYQLMVRMFRFEKSNEEWVEKLFIYVIVATILGARLGHVFFYDWEYYSQNLFEIISPVVWTDNGLKLVGFQGLASHGGALGIILAVWIYSRKVTHRSIIWTLDRLVVPTALVAAMIRTGNLMNSEIYGVATTLPWGFIFERNGETIAKHPTQIYEALCYLVTFVVLLYFYFKKRDFKDREGFLLGVFFIGVFFSRFMIEFIKEDQKAFEAGMLINMGQLLSIPFIAAGIWLVVRSLRRPPIHYKNK